MTAKGLISTEYDYFYLDAQRKLAKRLILKPLVEHLDKQPRRLGFEELFRLLDGKLTDSSALAADEKWFDSFEAAADGLLSRTPEPWTGGVAEFPEPDEEIYVGDPRFSKRAFLLYLLGRLIEASLRKGLMTCVAQNGSLLAAVSPAEFGNEDDEEVLILPAGLDPFPIQKFTAHWCEALGADRLWLALSQELEESLAEEAASEFSSSSDLAGVGREHQSRKGYDDEDQPYVDLVCELLDQDNAKNPNHAVQMLERGLWKTIAPNAISFEQAVSGVGSYDSKRSRIYKKVMAVRKPR